MRVHTRRLFVIIIRTSYRWICTHPYLLGCVGVAYLLYRACPLLFSPLLAASPVLVCTFVLLGAILSFGETNIIPEIETEPETTVHEAALFTTEASRDPTVPVFRRHESFSVGPSMLGGPRHDRLRPFFVLERLAHERASYYPFERQLSEVSESKVSSVPDTESVCTILESDEKKVDEDDADRETDVAKTDMASDHDEEKGHLSEDSDFDEQADSKNRHLDVAEIILGSAETHVTHHEQSNMMDGETPDKTNHDEEDSSDGETSLSEIEEEIAHISENEAVLISEQKMMDDSKEDQVDLTPWRPMRHEEGEDDDDDDDSLDSSSDGAESSSPDPSMTDIIPMLDELHPLLHSENPEEPDMSSSDSDEGTESDNDDESKSPIKWTEADQKNVMDLGSLELERNQRLESLIARRRARNNMRNLIDFDCADVPFNMPPISTARQNPFDLSYDDMGLPPIPGSAPSIMFARRRNPFDLPYEPNEEKPDLKDSDFDEQADSKNPHRDVAEIILGSATHHEQSNMMDGETPDKTNHDEEDSSDGETSLSEIEEEIAHISENEAVLISEQKVDLHEKSGTSSGGSDIHVARGMEDDYHHDKEPAFITPLPSLEESAIHDLCGLVGDHHETPVYDSSPPSASRFPSFSSVSSDHKPDLPGKSDEEVQENADNEREVYSESIGPGETETSTREVGENSMHDTGEASVLVAEHVKTLEESPDVVHDIAETSVNRSVAEGIVQEEENKQKDEASPQTFTADIPIDSYATLSSGAVEYVETHSFNDEDAPKAEQDPVQSSVSDAKEETHSNQTMVIEVDSVNTSAQNVGSEETTPSESDREPTCSDKSVVEQSSLEPGEDQEPARAAPLSVDTTELSCLTSDTSSSPAESPEYETPMVGEGSKTEFFQETVNEGPDHVVEQLDQLTDLHEISQSPPEVIAEEADEIKEIDEGLLSELDTIGDFGVKEVVTDSEPGPSSVGSDTAKELTEALPVLEVRSVEDIESAFQQIHEGAEVEDVILPSTVQDQLAQENSENSTEAKSELTVVEATSKDDLDTAMNEAVVESMGKQPMSPETDGGSGETKCGVEMEPSGSLIEERSLDETNKEEDEESRPKERTTSDVSSTETRSLEETSKSIEEMSTEVISERVVIPTEATESSNVTLSDEVVTEEAKAETSSNLDGTVQSPESKETREDSEESISEVKTEKNDKGRSDSSGSSSSSSSSDSD
ncbi:BnaC09g39930D [Brassica napus]|uniref:BnaC09g39930D protein n=1 Tax=Brassica napus TaxID=3708 RepID=A0A078GLI6_BRANA|nr:BnaC09g39930D [Brassica napus]